jgi:hypothetical protein
MRELNQSELQSIQGANYSDLEVIGLTGIGSSLAGVLGYFMSYQTFSAAEGLLFMAAGAIPTVLGTGMVLGGIQVYHHFRD